MSTFSISANELGVECHRLCSHSLSNFVLFISPSQITCCIGTVKIFTIVVRCKSAYRCFVFVLLLRVPVGDVDAAGDDGYHHHLQFSSAS